MKAVVFTSEPGSGEAFLATFTNKAEAQQYAQDNGYSVFDFDELFNEIGRLRKWMKEAYSEFCAARDQMTAAHRILDDLYEYDEEIAS